MGWSQAVLDQFFIGISTYIHSIMDVQTGWNESLRGRSSPFALRVKDVTPSHSEEPSGGTLPSSRDNSNQNWPKTALAAHGLFWTSFHWISKRNLHSYVQMGWNKLLRARSSPFALRVKDVTRFLSREPSWGTLPSAREKLNYN
jgi:hypothetical protein